MTRLDQDRREIDEIDEEIAALFEKRFAIVRDVIDYKIENRLPILNSDRESEITERNVSRIEDDDIRPFFRTWYKDLLSLSRQFQQRVLDEK